MRETEEEQARLRPEQQERTETEGRQSNEPRSQNSLSLPEHWGPTSNSLVKGEEAEGEGEEVEEEAKRPQGHGDGAHGANCGAAFALSVSGGERKGEDGRRSGRTGECGWRAGTRGQLGGSGGCPVGRARGPGLLGRPDERDVAEWARQPPPGGGEECQGQKGRPHLIPRGSGGEWKSGAFVCVCVRVWI